MKALILAAGSGTRLRPLTDDRPKCLVALRGTALIEYQLHSLTAAGINHVAIVTGYKQEALHSWPLIKYYNERHLSTNMVASLFCASAEFDDDLLLIYGDVVFEPDVICRLRDSKEDFSVVIDLGWQALWRLRMDDPLADAESLKMDQNHYITEVGRRATSYADIQGQYTGLIKLSKNGLAMTSRLYSSLDRNATYDGKNFDNMFMTSFIQIAIDRGMPVKAVLVEHGWLEVDTMADLHCYENNCPKEIFDFDLFSGAPVAPERLK